MIKPNLDHFKFSIFIQTSRWISHLATKTILATNLLFFWSNFNLFWAYFSIFFIAASLHKDNPGLRLNTNIASCHLIIKATRHISKSWCVNRSRAKLECNWKGSTYRGDLVKFSMSSTSSTKPECKRKGRTTTGKLIKPKYYIYI